MPRISYKCSCGNHLKKYYSSHKKVKDKIECDKCEDGELVRQLSSPTTTSEMVMDNGVQSKAVTVNREIVDIIEDREESDKKKRGDAVLGNLI